MQLNVEKKIPKLIIFKYFKRIFKRQANDSSSRMKSRTNTPPDLCGIVQFIPDVPI